MVQTALHTHRKVSKRFERFEPAQHVYIYIIYRQLLRLGSVGASVGHAFDDVRWHCRQGLRLENSLRLLSRA